jgi:hypothetical protein|tara:strand:- start:9608 stop:10348 length:741 start_codon:yes stop_codon:yes gene_type:complete
MIFNKNNYYKWYFLPKVKFSIIKYTRNRETALITDDKKITLRMLKIHSVQHIDFHLKNLNWYRNKWNMYYSMAEYSFGIPNQKFDLKRRDNSKWRAEHWRYMVANDFLIDIDATNHLEMDYAKKSTINIVDRLVKFDIPHNIRFSGCGFHIIIPYEYFKDKKYSFNPKDRDNIYSQFSLISKKLNLELSEMVDYKINDSRRICKLPYSLVIYENNIYVCYPLTYKGLLDFKLENMKPEVIYAKINT